MTNDDEFCIPSLSSILLAVCTYTNLIKYTWQVWIITWMNITYVQLYIQTTSSQLLSRTSNSIRYRAKLSLREDTHCNTQFYIQFLYKPHLRTWILLFGSFGRVRAVREIFNFLYIVASALQSEKNITFGFKVCILFWLKIGYQSGF